VWFVESTDVSEEHIASIFRVEEKAEQETCFHAFFIYPLSLLFDSNCFVIIIVIYKDWTFWPVPIPSQG
jgi:hypothetical protein